MCDVAYRIVPLLLNFIDLQAHFSYFPLKISVAYFSSLRLSPGDLIKDDIVVDDLEWPLKVVLGTINGFIVCVSNIQHNLEVSRQ